MPQRHDPDAESGRGNFEILSTRERAEGRPLDGRQEIAGLETQDFEAVHRSHAAFYRRLALEYVGSEEDAEEAVQDAFLRAWRWRGSFRGDCALANWIGVIVRRECLDKLRRRKARRRSPEVPLGPHPDSRRSPFEEAYRSEQRRLVIRLARRLPRSPREFIHAVFAGEFPDMRLQRNKNNRHRAVRALQELLQCN